MNGDTMRKKNVPKKQLIIRALLKGKPLKLNEIKEVLSKAGEKTSDLPKLLSILTNPEKCPLGHFIQKKKDGKAFVYSIFDAALNLDEETAYALTQKSGEYNLEQALAEYPDLKKYVKTEQPVIKPDKKVQKAKSDKPVERKIPAAVPIIQPAEPSIISPEKSLSEELQNVINNQEININIRITFGVE